MAQATYREVTAAYRKRFGPKCLDWCNDFALEGSDEVIEILTQALKRGTPATEDEIRWMIRDIRDDVIY